jgi:hypothetical protein
VTYLVYVGCHLITTCRPHHQINGSGRYRWMKISGCGRYGQIVEGGHKHVERQLKGFQCTKHEHARCEHVWHEHVGCKYIGHQLKGLQCTGLEHVGRQIKGTNLRGSTLLGANMSGMNMYWARTCWAPT